MLINVQSWQGRQDANGTFIEGICENIEGIIEIINEENKNDAEDDITRQ